MDMATPLAPQPAATVLTLTIPAGQSLSTAVSCGTGGTMARIYMPSAWDGELLTFLISPDGTSFYSLYRYDNIEIAFNITPNTMVLTEPYVLSSNNWIKLRSGSMSNPRKQSADRVFMISLI